MIKFRMLNHHGLLFCFLSALCGGNSGLVDAKPTIFTGSEGGNGTVTCYFNVSGTRRVFCRDDCKEKDILIETDATSANNGRYSIRYKTLRSGRKALTVTITNLVQSDAGRYSCGLGGSSEPMSLQDFHVKVSDGLLNKSSGFFLTNAEGQDIESACSEAARRSRSRMFFCRGKCKNQEDILIETDQDKAQNGRYGVEYKNGSLSRQYVTITRVVKSDSGEYTCGYGRASSPDSSFTFLLLVDTPTRPNTTLQPFTTSVPSASTPNNPTTTTQSLISSSGSSTPSPVFSKTINPTTPAVPTSPAPTTTQSLISSSRGSTSSSVSPKNTNQPTTAAPTTSKPNTTLQPFATYVPSASTPNNPTTTTTQSLISSSEDSTPSPVFTKSMRQTTPAAPTTSAPLTTTQSFSSTSSPVFPKTTNQPQAAGLLRPTSIPSKVLPVAVSVPVFGGLLLSGFGLFFYMRKIKKCTEQIP